MHLTADSHLRVNYRQAKDTGLLSTLTERSVFDQDRYWRRLARAPRTRKATFTYTPYEIHGDELWIPRGLMGWLRKLPFPLQVADNRISVPLYNDLLAPDVRAYQAAAVDFAVENHQCLLWAPTGSGKTRIMSSIIQRIKERTCIIVTSLDIMEQVIDELRLSLEVVPGVRGGGEDFEGPEVTVCQAQSFRNWTDGQWAEFTKGYGCVMIDECHLDHRKLAEKFPAKFRIGLTATPDVVMDSSEIVQWIFGKKFAVADHQGLVDQGYRVQPIFDWLRTTFTVDNPSDYGALLDALVADRPRAELICKDVRAKWIEGRSVLVLCGRIAYGKALIDILSGLGVPSTLLTSETNRNARKEALDKARRGEIKVLVATSLADCGLDIPLLDTLYLAFPGRSSNLTHQRIGRVLRRAPDKGEPLVIDVVDDYVPTLFSQALHREAAMKTYGELPKRLVRERKRDRKPEF